MRTETRKRKYAKEESTRRDFKWRSKERSRSPGRVRRAAFRKPSRRANSLSKFLAFATRTGGDRVSACARQRRGRNFDARTGDAPSFFSASARNSATLSRRVYQTFIRERGWETSNFHSWPTASCMDTLIREFMATLFLFIRFFWKNDRFISDSFSLFLELRIFFLYEI